ncbi:PREDICTED: cytochrome b561 and DOMON domain-containing protein At3g07570 [Tarenaya hassleriana]|uniref:cytochrome b561 and DOMON domain-containing protein At3g07570 n=1 Tax=Tarenaya hassleriana TaxID=28532 RepID=UPI00053C49C3|nr:PREDICTED: cytochrome b561 and DOMON domain-containing protein At3g07570 [Tarenaya hassleriana]
MKVSSSSFIFRFVVLHLLTLSAIVSAQQPSDSCSSTLPLNDLSFNASLLQCAEVWSLQNYILRYSRTDANTWSFVLSAPDSNSFIAIGFSTNGQMIGSSAVVGWIPSGGRGEVKQYFLGGKTPDQVVVDQGELTIVNGSMKIESVSSRLYLSFQLTTAEQPRTQVLYALGRAGAFPSSPDYSLTEHRTMISTSLNYITAVQRVVKAKPHSRLRKTHGLLNMFGWGIFIVIGSLVARHLKRWDPMWFYAHTALQTTGFLLGLTGVICGLVLENRTKASTVSTHKGLGITILVMGCLQVMALLARPDKQSKYRRYWNWYHHNVGRILIILAIANVFYGIHLGKAGSAWNGGYGFVVAVLFLVAVGLEVRKFMQK